jgi:hypothetical protein
MYHIKTGNSIDVLETENVRNQDNFDEVRKNQAIHTLSRWTPDSDDSNNGEEPLEVLLNRSEQVAKGMQIVLQKEFVSDEVDEVIEIPIHKKVAFKFAEPQKMLLF